MRSSSSCPTGRYRVTGAEEAIAGLRKLASEGCALPEKRQHSRAASSVPSSAYVSPRSLWCPRRLNAGRAAEDGAATDPSVEAASVVPDEVARILTRLDQVQVLTSPDFDQHNVVY